MGTGRGRGRRSRSPPLFSFFRICFLGRSRYISGGVDAAPDGGSLQAGDSNPVYRQRRFAERTPDHQRGKRPDRGVSAGAFRVYQYAQADFGKIADYAAAYENGTGKRGPWSNVTSLLISG